MTAYIPNNEEMKVLIREIAGEAIDGILVDEIRENVKTKWLTTEKVMDLLSYSRPYIQK